MILLAFLGCRDACPPETAASLELGTGSESFTPLQAGDALSPQFGNQGGFHYEIALRATGIERDEVSVHLEMWHEGILVAESDRLRDFRCRRDDGVLETYDLRLIPQLAWDSADTGYLDPTVRGELELRVTVTDARNTVLEATTNVTVDP